MSVTWTPDEIAAAIIKQAVSTAQERRNNHRANFHELDYYCGVMAAMQALELWDRVPAYWHMSLISGQTVTPLLEGEAPITPGETARYHERCLIELREELGQPGEVLCGVRYGVDLYQLVIATGYGDVYTGIGPDHSVQRAVQFLNTNGCSRYPSEGAAREALTAAGYEIIEAEDL